MIAAKLIGVSDVLVAVSFPASFISAAMIELVAGVANANFCVSNKSWFLRSENN